MLFYLLLFIARHGHPWVFNITPILGRYARTELVCPIPSIYPLPYEPRSASRTPNRVRRRSRPQVSGSSPLVGSISPLRSSREAPRAPHTEPGGVSRPQVSGRGPLVGSIFPLGFRAYAAQQRQERRVVAAHPHRESRAVRSVCQVAVSLEKCVSSMRQIQRMRPGTAGHSR